MARTRLPIMGLVALTSVLGGCGETSVQPGAGPVVEGRSPERGGSEKYQVLVGRWLRPDGGYVLEVTGVDADGRAAVAYYNPRPIHVANARAVYEVDHLKLFVELRDTGYPGSTYTLLYDPGKNQLQGTYFQAAMNETYDVLFVRADP